MSDDDDSFTIDYQQAFPVSTRNRKRHSENPRSKRPEPDRLARFAPKAVSSKVSHHSSRSNRQRGRSMDDRPTRSMGAVAREIRERKPPFSPEDVVGEFAALLKSYGITKVLGDRYAGEWVKEPFRAHHISYESAAKPKSDLYRDFLPLVNSKKADLLDHPKLLQQLVGLERRVARSGKDSIDHSPGAHDDIANAVAGVITNLGVRRWAYDTSLAWVSGDNDADFNADWRAERLRHYLQFGGRGLFR